MVSMDTDKAVGGSILGCWLLSIFLSLATTAVLYYVVFHFIAKFW